MKSRREHAIRSPPACVAGQGVHVHFAGVKAVRGVDITLEHGQILGLIGPNGAGKTTLVNVMTGFERPTAGKVFLMNEDVTGLAPRHLAERGVARTFQGGRLFGRLSVFENVAVGGLRVRGSPHQAREHAWKLLKRMNLTQKAAVRAAALPYGDQRRLGILRALATRPSFLLLDEPAAGLNEEETDALLHSIRAIRDDYECGVLVIEHDMRFIMSLCEMIQVLDQGESICVGPPETVRTNPRVVTAYLGERQKPHDAGS